MVQRVPAAVAIKHIDGDPIAVLTMKPTIKAPRDMIHCTVRAKGRNLREKLARKTPSGTHLRSEHNTGWWEHTERESKGPKFNVS